MKCLAVFLLLFAFSAEASTQLIIRSGGQSATVLMLAVTENPDAISFYDLLTVPAKNQGGKESKQIGFIDSEGKRSVEATCAFSKIAGRTGSCTLVFNMARGMDIAPGKVSYVLEGSEADRIAQLFRSGEGEIFRSEDGHLSMTASPKRFEINYR